MCPPPRVKLRCITGFDPMEEQPREGGMLSVRRRGLAPAQRCVKKAFAKESAAELELDYSVWTVVPL